MNLILLLLAASAAIAKDKPPVLDQKALTDIARAEAIAAHYETQLVIVRAPYDSALRDLRQKVAVQDSICAKGGLKFDEPTLSCVKPPAPPPSVQPIAPGQPQPSAEVLIPKDNPPPAPMPKK